MFEQADLPWLIEGWQAQGSVADDEVAEIVHRAIGRDLAATLDGAPMTLDRLAADFAPALGLPGPDAQLAIGMYLRYFTPTTVTPAGLVARDAALVEGVTFRHVLTHAEAATERLEVGVDLGVVLGGPDDGRLPDGTSLRCEFRTAVDGVSRRGTVEVVEGPAGWLGGAGAGDVVAVTRRDDEVTVDVVEPGLLNDAVVEAFRDARIGLADELPTSVHRVFNVAAADSHGFEDLGVPLPEMLVEAGFSVFGDQVGPADHPWGAAATDALRSGIASVMAAAGLQEVELAGDILHLVDDLFGPACRFAGESARTVPDDRVHDVAALLGRPGVAGSVWTIGLGPDPDRPALESTLDVALSLRDRTGSNDVSGPARLALMCADGLDRVDLLPTLVEQAALADVDDPKLCSIAGDMALDRGDVADAHRHWLRGGVIPWSDSVRRVLGAATHSFTAERNERCPCGSDRKFKRCHGGNAPPPPSSVELARLLVARLEQHAFRRLAFTFGLSRQAGLVDEEWPVVGADACTPFLQAVTWFAGGLVEDLLETRGPLLPEPDRTLARSWCDAELVVGSGSTGGRMRLLGIAPGVPVAGSAVGWLVPVDEKPVLVCGAPLGVDPAVAGEAFVSAGGDPDAIARALGGAWRRAPHGPQRAELF